MSATRPLSLGFTPPRLTLSHQTSAPTGCLTNDTYMAMYLFMAELPYIPRSDPVLGNTTSEELVVAAESRKPPCALSALSTVPKCLEAVPSVGLCGDRAPFGGVQFWNDVTVGDFPPTNICNASATFALVHPAKTGGDSVLYTLLFSPSPPWFTYFHMLNAEELTYSVTTGRERSFSHYVVSMRDPIARLRSSFNFLPTAEIERCYPLPASGEGAFSAFAESLNETSACGAWARWALRSPAAAHIGQSGMLRQSIEAYTSVGWLEHLRQPGTSLFIVRLEHMDDDLAGMFEWLCAPPMPQYQQDHEDVTEPRENDKYISPRAHELLMRELASEYDAWRALEKLAVNGDVGYVDAALASNAKRYARASTSVYEQRRAERRGRWATRKAAALVQPH